MRCDKQLGGGEKRTLQTWLQDEGVRLQIIGVQDSRAANMVRAHLRCGLVAMQHGLWPTRTLASEAEPKLRQVAEDTALPRGFLRDLIQALLDGPPRVEVRECELAALLVEGANTPAERGVGATLTLALMGEGTGALYPEPALAFAPQDEFMTAAEQSRTYLRHLRRWDESHDVRWSLQRWDGQALLLLEGKSAGGAFGMGLLKLLAGE